MENGWRWQKLEETVSEKPSWGNPGPTRKRTITGIRRPQQRSTPVQVEDVVDDGGWDHAAAADSMSPDDTSGADGGTASSFCAERAGNATRGWALPAAVERQQLWDGVRPEVQRSYVVHLPDMRSLAKELRNNQRDLMQERLAAQPACCANCGSHDMQQLQPASVLYISTDSCFHLTVPRYKCAEAGCGGTFAPPPLVVGCFPATPKATFAGRRWVKRYHLTRPPLVLTAYQFFL
jgi:hypothetical protein